MWAAAQPLGVAPLGLRFASAFATRAEFVVSGGVSDALASAPNTTRSVGVLVNGESVWHAHDEHDDAVVPAARCAASSTASESLGFVYGGTSDGRACGTASGALDFLTASASLAQLVVWRNHTFVRTGVRGPPRAGASLVALASGAPGEGDDELTLVLVGGVDEGGVLQNDVYVLPPGVMRACARGSEQECSAWNASFVRVTPTGALPAARAGHSAAVVDGAVLVCGGLAAKAALSDCWRLTVDAPLATWAPLAAPMLGGARAFAGVAWAGSDEGSVFVLVGGLSGDGAPRSDVVLWDDVAGTWSYGGALPHPVSAPAVAMTACSLPSCVLVGARVGIVLYGGSAAAPRVMWYVPGLAHVTANDWTSVWLPLAVLLACAVVAVVVVVVYRRRRRSTQPDDGRPVHLQTDFRVGPSGRRLCGALARARLCRALCRCGRRRDASGYDRIPHFVDDDSI